MESIVQSIEFPGASASPAQMKVGSSSRVCDFSLALLAIVCLLPYFIVRSVRARSRCGRIAAASAHVGRYGKPISVYTFADSDSGCDPLTLVNIVRGDLAWVGPRPRTAPEIAFSLEHGVSPWLLVRPGLVPPNRLQQRAGIAYDRDEDEYDRRYVEARTVSRDLALLMRAAVSQLLVGKEGRPAPRELEFFGIRMLNTTMADALQRLLSRTESGRTTSVAFANPDCLNISLRHPVYAQVLRKADCVLPDGIGIKIGSRMKGVAMRDNLNGTDLLPPLCESARDKGLSLYLLGARPGVAEATSENLQRRFPGLRIAGVEHGYFGPDEEPSVVARVNEARPDILLVALGAPRQELFLAKWRAELRAPLRMGVGGLFDFYSGRIARAPLWLREIGMEWVWRLYQEPGRMWRRYLVGNPHFLYHVWREHRGALRKLSGLARLPIGLRTLPLLMPMVNTMALLKRQRWNLTVSAAEGCKRALDVAVCGTLLLGLAPLMGLVALLIKLESPGPVFFRQQRVGLWGEVFPMWKFRSMYVDAEVRKRELLDQNQMAGGVIFKMKRDPRITRVGRIIRRLSIDELPQLWNVLCGDMTLVGPRPSLPAEVREYALADRARLDAKPGITCIWQVSGRSDIPFKQQVAMDVEYIQTRSVRQDLALLARTVPAVVSGRGAY